MQFFQFLAGYGNAFSGVLVQDLLRYVIGAGGVYLVVNVLLAARLAGRKIRTKNPPPGQMGREILASLRTVFIFAALGSLIVLGSVTGVFRIYLELGELGLAYFVLSVAVLVVLHDAYFYWAHRLMHRPWFFRVLHRLHHRSYNPTPFTSYSFNAGEAAVHATFLPLALFVIPAHPLALLIFTGHMMLRNALGHCGYEVFPSRSDGRPLFDWMTTVTHHDLHHANAGWNMGLYFTWWDRWMGTEHPNYHEQFMAAAKPVVRSRLSGPAAIAFMALVCVPDQADAGGRNISGYWVTRGIGAVVKFERCRNKPDRICGRLVWAWSGRVSRHVTVGEIMIRDLRWTGKRWEDGLLVNPEDGRTYQGSVSRVGPDVIRLKGCAGIFCDSQDWRSLGSIKQLAKLQHIGSGNR